MSRKRLKRKEGLRKSRSRGRRNRELRLSKGNMNSVRKRGEGRKELRWKSKGNSKGFRNQRPGQREWNSKGNMRDRIDKIASPHTRTIRWDPPSKWDPLSRLGLTSQGTQVELRLRRVCLTEERRRERLGLPITCERAYYF